MRALPEGSESRARESSGAESTAPGGEDVTPPSPDRAQATSPNPPAARPRRRTKRVRPVEPASFTWVMTSPGCYIRVEHAGCEPHSPVSE